MPEKQFQGVLANPFAEQQSRSAQTIKGTIAAGGYKSFPALGQMFYVKELYASSTGDAANDLLIKTGFSAENPFNVGTGEGFGTLFDLFEVRNPNAFEVYFEIYVGFSNIVGFIDNRLNVVRVRPESLQPIMDGATEADGNAVITLAAGANQIFDGVAAAGRVQRKSITISNLNSTLPLYIRDAAGAPLGCIFPETAQVYFVSGGVQVFNPDGSASVDCIVGEVWYLRPGP